MSNSNISETLRRLGGRRIQIGYKSLEFCEESSFYEFQTGFRRNAQGESLINEEPGSWKAEWWVIGKDDLGDPIIFDQLSGQIYTAPIGIGKWEISCIGQDVDRFDRLIEKLSDLSIGREFPISLQNNPITTIEKGEYVNLVSNQKGINSEYWYLILDIETI